MAYAAVVTAVQILQQIIQYDHQYYSLLFADKQPIQSFLEKFSSLLAFLEDGEEANSCLEGRIRDAAYRAQDIVESHVSLAVLLEKESASPRAARRNSWGFLSTVQKVSFWRKSPDTSGDHLDKLHQDLQIVLQEVDSVLEEVMSMKIVLSDHKIEDLPSRDRSRHSGSRRTTLGGATSMVGFDEDLIQIKDQLCGGSSKLQVIVIVGMGGIGKTTLPNNVFYDLLTAYHFDIRAWATITQKHNLPDILLDLMNSMSKTGENLCPEMEGRLAESLNKSLKGRRYLVILDDIWSMEAWDEVKLLFPDDHNGSRIVLTMRLVDEALYANPLGDYHDMQFLNKDQSWNLLRDEVFGEERCPAELENDGKQIVKNCGGLPLCVVLVAGVLSKISQTKYQWENVARDVSSAVAMGGEQFSAKILSLSYNQLPRHLKPCFLYLWLRGFPEDREIPVFKLITLWIVEGFLKPVGSKILEEIAEEYLKDLVRRSLVIVTKRRSNLKFRFCSIHDLVRDLSIKIAWEVKFLHVVDGIQELIEKRHLSFSRSVEWFHFKHSDPIRSSARTVFCSVYTEWLMGFSLLRALDVVQVLLDAFPVEVLKLFHLRYLAFSSGFILHCTLPQSMAKHQNLQTLIVGSSVRFGVTDPNTAAHLPVWKMPKLRHLVFLNITLWPLPHPVGMDFNYPPLENSQTLSRVRNFRFTKMAVDMIPNLKKLSCLHGPGKQAFIEYNLHNLVHLQQLQTLSLDFKCTNNSPSRIRIAHQAQEIDFKRHLSALEGHDYDWFIAKS